jgi:predicted NBD/HSP70 family sugar kinase
MIDNDVRVAILGEWKRGAGRGYRNLLGVWVGTGVGGGLILDGEPYHGQGAAGEIGHIIVKPGGRVCSDGRKGHLEAYAGRGRMEVYARELHDGGRKTDLFKIMEKKGRSRMSSGVVAEALEHKDKLAEELTDGAVWALGVGLATVQNLLSLEAIVIGGGLGDRLGAPFVERIEKEMLPLLFVPDQPPKMLTTEHGDLSGAVGAADQEGYGAIAEAVGVAAGQAGPDLVAEAEIDRGDRAGLRGGVEGVVGGVARLHVGSAEAGDAGERCARIRAARRSASVISSSSAGSSSRPAA